MQVRNKNDKISIFNESVLGFIFLTIYVSGNPILELINIHLQDVGNQILNIVCAVTQGMDFKLVSCSLRMS